MPFAKSPRRMRLVVENPPSGETSHYHIVVIEWGAFSSLVVVD